MFLNTIILISSTSKNHEVDGNKNTQNMEELLNLNPNQSQYEQDLQDQQDTFEKVPNKTSKYNGVCWHKDAKKWQTQLNHKEKKYYGRYFDNEEHAAMHVNLFCDKIGIKRKNPMVIIEPDAIQQVPTRTSQYTGVNWSKDNKKWKVQLTHNKKSYFGGYFDNEKHAAMSVNLLCDKNEIERKNPMIQLEPDAIQLVPNQTSNYIGVCLHKDNKKWKGCLTHKQKKYYGGLFDNEEHAMSVNLLCDKLGIERKNPMIIIDPDAIQQDSNQTSKYIGVCWHKDAKQWEAQLMYKTKRNYGGLFANEEHAAMSVNFLCDKNGIERKNSMIKLEPDAIQQVPNQTSKYTGVCWHRKKKKWHTYLKHNKKLYYGGHFDNEDQAAMKVNLLCEKNGIKRKNPMILIKTDVIQQMKKKIKVKEENVLDGFKHECENRFIKSNNEGSFVTTASCQSRK